MSFVYPKYIISCEEYLTNDDGSLSFIKVFENKILNEIPTDFNFYIAVSLEYSLLRKEDREVFIRIIDPDGNNGSESGLDKSHDIKLKLRESKKNEINNVVSIINIKDMSIEKAGIYSILIYHGEELIAKHDILFSQGG